MPVANPTIGCYIGFSFTLNTGAWILGTSTLGTGTILGDTYVTVYTNVGSDVRSVSVQRGKSRELGQYQAGRCSVVLDNRSRDYDPLNLSGPYVTGGVTDVKPGRLLYVTATDPTTGLVHRLFTGRIRNWTLDYTGVFDSVATIDCTDSMTELANTTLVDVATTATDMGAVAAELLVAAGVSNFGYDEAIFTAQAMTWNTKALTALRKIEVSEQGALYVEPSGDVRFTSNSALIAQGRSRNSQATFGSGNLTFEDIEIDYDSELILNDVALTRTGGVEQTVQDTESIDAYGQRSYEQTGLANGLDADVLSIANYIVNKYDDPEVRITGIKMHPRKHADLMTQALIRQIRDRVTVTFAPVGGGTAISQELFITGIGHRITAQAGMETSYQFEGTEWSHGWLLGTDALGTAELGL